MTSSSKALWNRAGVGCLFLFALPFAAVGVFSGYRICAQVAQSRGARDWQEVPARIESVEIESHHSSDSTTYFLSAVYRYEYNGRSYSGTRVDLVGGRDNVGSFHRDAYAELSGHRTSGQPFRCFVNPRAPSEAVLYRGIRWQLIVFLSMFALGFGGVGFGLLAALPYARRKLAEHEAIQAVHPQEPWLWKPEWRDGRITTSAKAAVIMPSVFAALWNVISWPMVFFAADEIFDSDNRVALLALLFPLVGLLLFGWAIRALLRWRKFGESTLDLETLPVPVGGRADGRILTRWRFRPDTEVRARLSCVERRRRGKDSDERLLWQEEAVVGRGGHSFDGIQTAIPVTLEIPSDGRETEEGVISWKLEVTAPVAGVDYAAIFQLPVFGRTSPEKEESFEHVHEPDSAVREVSLDQMGISVVPETAGGRRYRFGRARQKGAAALLTAFLAIWSGVVFAIWHFKVPLFFLVMFSLAGVLIFVGVLDLWLTKRWVIASRGGLEFGMKLLGFGRRHLVPTDEIVSLEPKPGMQVGNKLYYRLLLETENKKRYTLAAKLDDLAVARRLVRSIKEDLGFEPRQGEKGGHNA